MDHSTFTVRLSADDRQRLAAVAERLERKQGDVLRLLLRSKARELGLMASPEQNSKGGQDER